MSWIWGSEQTSLELRHKQPRVKPLTRPSGIPSPAPPVYVPGAFEQDICLGAFNLVCSASYIVNILYLSVTAYERYSYSCKETIKYLVNEHNQSSCLYESEGNHSTLVRRPIKTPLKVFIQSRVKQHFHDLSPHYEASCNDSSSELEIHSSRPFGCNLLGF